MKMKRVILEQGTPEWHEWRESGIGSSDITAIMGSSPYKTPLQLWEEKCGYAEPQEPNRAMMHGTKLEPRAREWINKNRQWKLTPWCIQDRGVGLFKASLDGYCPKTKVVVEIKCPFSLARIDAARDHSAFPEHWIDQLRWQMMVAGVERGYLAVYDHRVDGCYMFEHWADHEAEAIMEKKALDFWIHVKAGIPPILMPGDYAQIDNIDLKHLAEEYRALDAQEKEIAAKKKALREPIIAFGEGSNFKGHGLVVTHKEGSKRYNWQQMEADGIDLTPYERIGNPKVSIRIKE